MSQIDKVKLTCKLKLFKVVICIAVFTQVSNWWVIPYEQKNHLNFLYSNGDPIYALGLLIVFISLISFVPTMVDFTRYVVTVPQIIEEDTPKKGDDK